MSIFDWCKAGQHEDCHRSYVPFRIDVVKGKSVVVMLEDQTKNCECIKRGCKCYTKPAERKPAPRRRKRK